MKISHWSKEEITLLKNIYNTRPVAEIARQFNRTPYAVRSAAKRLNIQGLVGRPTFGKQGFPSHIDIARFNHLTETEKAYIAGIMDGEGSILFSHRKNGAVYVAIQIANTDMRMIKFLQDKIPYMTMHIVHRERKEHKECYQLYIRRQRAVVYFLHLLLPYLVSKKDKASSVLNQFNYLLPS
jgi:hypothetical protein